MIAGLLAFGAGVGLLFARPEILTTYHYNQHVIATTHLFVLGWLCTIVMGAVYQLVPVALECRLHSERLARVQFVFHVVGFVGMVAMFWIWNMKQVGHFGVVLGCGVALFVYNIGRTLMRVPRWNLIASSVASTLFWLCFTVTVGLMVAAGKCVYESVEDGKSTGFVAATIEAVRSAGMVLSRFDPIATMHSHAHVGVIGIFLMLIVGVSYRLIPMFTLSEIQSRRRAAASIVLLNVGLAGVFVSVLLRSSWKLVFALVVCAAFAVYLVEIWAILRARKRQTIDWGVKYFLTGLGLLPVLSVVGVVLSHPRLPLTGFTGQLENVYGFLAIGGAISLCVVGMLYKIIPFIVWYSSYSQQIGRAKVPALAELYSARVQQVAFWTYLAGLAISTAAILLSHNSCMRVGAALLCASVGALLVNGGLMLRHLWSPQTAPSIRSPQKAGPLTPASHRA